MTCGPIFGYSGRVSNILHADQHITDRRELRNSTECTHPCLPSANLDAFGHGLADIIAGIWVKPLTDPIEIVRSTPPSHSLHLLGPGPMRLTLIRPYRPHRCSSPPLRVDSFSHGRVTAPMVTCRWRRTPCATMSTQSKPNP